jgi:hypothetical protein
LVPLRQEKIIDGFGVFPQGGGQVEVGLLVRRIGPDLENDCDPGSARENLLL